MRRKGAFLRLLAAIALLLWGGSRARWGYASWPWKDASNIPCSLETGPFPICPDITGNRRRIHLAVRGSATECPSVRIVSAPETLLLGETATVRFEPVVPAAEGPASDVESSASKVEYLYRLRPHETRMYATSRNYVRFYDLPPGDYEFEVTARDTDGTFLGGPGRVEFSVSDRLDFDGDGIDNAWEAEFGLDPRQPGDAELDVDRDGLVTFEEYACGTDPFSRDSDLDGLADADDDRLDPFVAAYPNRLLAPGAGRFCEVPFVLESARTVYVTACAGVADESALAVTIRRDGSERLVMAFVGDDPSAPYRQETVRLALSPGNYVLGFHLPARRSLPPRARRSLMSCLTPSTARSRRRRRSRPISTSVGTTMSTFKSPPASWRPEAAGKKGWLYSWTLCRWKSCAAMNRSRLGWRPSKRPALFAC